MAISLGKPVWSRIVYQGIVAGIIGGILIDAFLYFSTLATAHHASILGIWQFVASAAVGPVAFSSTSYAWLGLLLHAVVSIGWAIGYAYAATTRVNILNAPWLSGVVFGIIVWLIMQFVLMLAHSFTGLTLASFITGIIAHTVFYGIPVALTIRGLAGRAA